MSCCLGIIVIQLYVSSIRWDFHTPHSDGGIECDVYSDRTPLYQVFSVSLFPMSSTLHENG